MMYVETKFRVNVYLDTNILLDYIGNVSQALNYSINYLVSCPFVHLRSSHYVLFEFVENRKALLFFEKTKKEGDVYKKGLLKRSWENNNHDYLEFCDEIKQQVMSEVAHLKNDLNIDFDEHVFHEGLLYPTNEVCLNTKISKEDSLVTVSCMNPKFNDPIDYCLILTHDRQYCKSFDEAKETVFKILSNRHMHLPKLVNAVEFPINDTGGRSDLYSVKSNDLVLQFWNKLLVSTLKNMLNDIYLGETYKYGSKGVPAKCIYIDASENLGKQLRKSEGLVFISKDLRHYKIIDCHTNGRELEYFNMGRRCVLPEEISENPKFSFYKEDIKKEDLEWLRNKGNAVFYYDL